MAAVKVKTIIILLILSNHFNIYSQWNAIYKEDSITSILYNLQSDNKLHPSKSDYHFYNNNRFSKYDFKYNQSYGYELFKFNRNNFNGSNQKVYNWQKLFIEPLQITNNKTYLYFHPYIKNTDNFIIYIHTLDNVWYHYTVKVVLSGYQVPKEISINKFTSTVSGENIFKNSSTRKIDKIILQTEVTEVTEGIKPKFIISNLLLYNVDWVEKECYHPFFFDIFNTPKKYYNNKKSSIFYFLNGQHNMIPDELYKFHITSPIYLKSIDSLNNEMPLLKKFIFQTIIDYPFYQERKLNKDSILIKYDLLVKKYNDTTNTKAFTQALSTFIKKEFKDGHFVVYPTKSQNIKKTKPISIYKINNSYQIAAIFDTTYNSMLSIEDKVVEINNKPIDLLIDSIVKEQYGSLKRKIRVAESLILLRSKTDSCVITIIDSCSIRKNVMLKYDGKHQIPINFKKLTNFDFKMLDNDISYLRIPNMSTYGYYIFLNSLDRINNSNGLIIDLRGNSGGEMMTSINIFSHLINKPTVYSHFELFRKNGVNSYIVKPNKSKLSEEIEIIILGDEKTACSAEAFIMAMKKLNNVTFISSSNTSGALIAMHNIIFPSGAVVSVDCLAPKNKISNGVSIEEIGIEPDIWVQKSSIFDLIPYKDKVLDVAKKFIYMNYR